MTDPDQLGPYSIVRRIGRGGMGIVYEGRNAEGEPAAIKVLAAALASDDGFRQRFEDEIETLKKLKHENIVRLYGYGEQEGAVFYAMELVAGVNLEEELQNGRRFDWRETTDIGGQLARALKHAHDHGVIHRDIKPANLLMTPEGVVKLSDFGIAKLFGNSGMTAVGGVLGTAEYMAPEQADGRAVTNRCDLYSLGCVLYALLAGRPPFRANSLPEMLQLQRFAEPDPVRRYNSEVPFELEELIEQLMRKDPLERIPNPMVLARRLESMKRALTLREERRKLEGDTRPDVRAKPAAPDPALFDNETLAEGQVAAEYEAGTGFDLTDLPQPPANSGQQTPATEDPHAEGSSRFTRVREEELGLGSSGSQPGLGTMIAQITVLASTLIGLGFFWWWLQRPETADTLYAKIDATVDVSPENLRDVEDEIEEFLRRFPKDERIGELQGYQEQLDLEELERKLKNLRRRFETEIDTLSAVERAYCEAINYLEIEPERGRARLQALLDMYPEEDPQDPRMSLCLELARRRLDKLDKQFTAYVNSERFWLQSRLELAAELKPKEPKKAAAIYRGIVERYRHKGWAEEEVAQALDALSTLPGELAAGEPDLFEGESF